VPPVGYHDTSSGIYQDGYFSTTIQCSKIQVIHFMSYVARPTKLFTLILVAVLPLALSSPAFAQDSIPSIEIFGGGSYLPSDGSDFPRDTSFGFQTSITGNMNRWFGIVGDFGGHYSHVAAVQSGTFQGPADSSVYEYLVGPRFTKRTDRFNVFGHVLLGGARGRTNLCSKCRFSDNELTFGAGGGLDLNVSHRVAIRVLQFDYLGSLAEMLEDNGRFGAGVVLRLGSK